MIFRTSENLISAARRAGFLPQLKNPPNTSHDDVPLHDPPKWPADLPLDQFYNGIPNMRRRPTHMRRFNSFHKKKHVYDKQQNRLKQVREKLDKAVPLAAIHRQAKQKLGQSLDPEDQIFLKELANLYEQPDNFKPAAEQADWVESLEKERARVEYASLKLRRPHSSPSFSSFQRRRRQDAVEAAALRIQKKRQPKLTPIEESELERRAESERERMAHEAKKEAQMQAARAASEKAREPIYREKIRSCLEQGLPPPPELQHREDLIQEVAQQVTEAAFLRQQEAARRIQAERERQWARQQAEEEEQRRVQEIIDHHVAQLAAQRAREEEQRQREAQRLRDEAAAREAEIRHAERVARWVQEEARRCAEQEAMRAQEEALRGTSGKAMKAEILKWHPDKLNVHIPKVHPEHQKLVREAGELVAKFLNDLKGN
ncbi:hypothetical protein H0H93_003908 [Arthromyces matolae]|nr:hypothetical protein H0H93_003908 [Arthromyces matolae]